MNGTESVMNRFREDRNLDSCNFLEYSARLYNRFDSVLIRRLLGAMKEAAAASATGLALTDLSVICGATVLCGVCCLSLEMKIGQCDAETGDTPACFSRFFQLLLNPNPNPK